MFDLAVQSNPEYAQAPLGLAMTLHQLGEHEAAHEELRKIITFFPDTPLARQAMELMAEWAR